MKKLLPFLLTFIATKIFPCDLTSINVLSVTDNGNGTYTYTAQICLGISPNWGGTDAITIDADATILNSGFTPSVSTTYNYCDVDLPANGSNCLTSSGTIMGYPPAGGNIINVNATATGSVSGGNLTYNGTEVLAPVDVFVPAGDCDDCNNPTNLCFNVTFITSGAMTSVQLIGGEQYNNNCGGTCCPDEMDNTIPVPDTGCTPPTAMFTSNSPQCIGSGFDFTNTGTMTGVTWSWTFENGSPSSSTSQNPTGIAWSTAGNFAVTLNTCLTAQPTCCSNYSQTVQVDSMPTLSSTKVNTTCGQANGSIDLAISGGSAPYSYLWSNGETTQDLTFISAGNFTVTVTDNNGCTATRTETLTNSGTVPTCAITVSGTTCLTGNSFNFDYSGTTNCSMGNSPIISWSFPGGTPSSSSSDTANGVTYTTTGTKTATLTVTDCNSPACVVTCSTTVVVNPNPIISISSTDVTCNGSGDGTATATATDGTSPYSYSWSNGDTTSSVFNLPSSVYSITVTDTSGCTAIATDTISEPAFVATYTDTVNLILHDGINCIDYPIVKIGNQWWMEENVNATLYADSTPLVDGTGAGSIAGDYTTKYFFNYNDTVAYSATYGKLYTWAAIMNGAASSDSIPSGVQGVCPTGWHLPGDAEWKQLEMELGMSQTSADSTGWRGTDEGGKMKQTDTTLWISPNTGATNTSGFTALPGGFRSTGGPFYNVGSNGVWWTAVVSSATAAWYRSLYSTEARVSRNSNGKGDGFSCRCVKDIDLFVNLTVSISDSVNVSCNGLTDGSATVTPTGGTTPYTYSWTGGQTTSTVTGLAAATYFVTVTDAASNTATASVTITEPSTITATATNNGPVCTGNTLNLTGGAGGMTSYSWSGPNGFTSSSQSPTVSSSATTAMAGTYAITVTNSNNCTNTGTTTVTVFTLPTATAINNGPVCTGNTLTLSGGAAGMTSYSWSGANAFTSSSQSPTVSSSATTAMAGTYTITITNSNNCTNTATTTVTIIAAPTATATSVNTTCGQSNGNATANPSAGATPYTYTWSNGQTGQTATGLAAGTYSVTVTDGAGCTATASATITSSSSPTITTSTTNETCGSSNGSATANASGGTTPYSYSWNTTPVQNSATATGLIAGNYSVTVTDAASCTAFTSATVNSSSAPTVTISSTDASCNGCSDGTAATIVSGGTSPYSYQWSNGAQTQSIASLQAGIYTVTVTDSSGCTATATATISQPSCTLNITFSSTNVSCNGGSNGSATATPSGGTAPYSYLWSNGATVSSIFNIQSSTFIITITDAASCTATASVTITQPAALTATATATAATCGISNGTATASASGGASPYTYQWSNGNTTAFADSLPAGIYMVTVTDANACTNFSAVIINSTGSPLISVNSVTNISCNAGINGAIDISVSGGATPYSYSWSNGVQTQDVASLSAGPYEIIVTGNNGCASAQSIFVSQPNPVMVSVSVNNASCGGNNDGDATITVSGGTSPYTYLWGANANSQTTATATGLIWGIYDVTITDNNGCVKTVAAAVAETGGATVQIDSIIPAGCGGTGAIFVSVTGGATPYSYSWTNGATIQNLTNAAAGNYGLIVTDDNGCMGAVSATISAQPLLPDPICLITVDTVTGTNKLVWQKTLGAGIASYKIYKETTIAGIYQLAGTVPYSNLSVFTDSVANPLIRSWRYKLSSVDSCGNESVLSAEHKTIHLTVNQGLGNTYNLIWDHYQGFAFGTYYIWRYKQNTGWVLRDSLPGNLTSWTDYTPPTPFSLRYLIEIIHPDGCTATKAAENHNSSRSNKTYPIAPPAPNLSATATSNDENGTCNGNATVTVSGGVTPYTYLWNDSAVTDTDAVTGLCAGTYTCTVTDADGDTITVTVDILLTNISKIGEEEITIKIFPNPSKGKFFMELNHSITQSPNNSVTISNMLGETILKSEIKNLKSEIDLSKPGSGIYFLQIITSNGTSTPVKIIVH